MPLTFPDDPGMGHYPHSPGIAAGRRLPSCRFCGGSSWRTCWCCSSRLRCSRSARSRSSYPIKFGQFLLLFVGFVVLVTMNLVLLRRVLAPLLRLTEVMTTIDPDTPGTRLTRRTRAAPRAALAHAFNGMLDRLESARREAARTALEAQEAERLRVAQELHDEIGQTLTAVTIQTERAAEGDPRRAPQALRDVARTGPRQPRRGAPDRPRAAPGGARRPRPRQRADRPLQPPGRARAARGSSATCRAAARRWRRRWSWSIYRVAQESLTNALRHANARSVTPLRSQARRRVGRRSRVRDDGAGMPRRAAAGHVGDRGHARAGDAGGRALLDRVGPRRRDRGAA